MGNKIARTTQASATEYYLHDLPSSFNLVLKEVLGRGRFLKSIQCKHDEGLVIVKVYFKRGDEIDLRFYERRLSRIRDIFRSLDHPHVWPFQFWLETDKAAYLLRQYFFNNLHDRLSTRPFLGLIEKKWLAFQLLYAAKQSHEHGICHGDIKCENVLVTSWNWVYLADFASFKPTYIPDDDPSDFSFFFDTGGRRLCYLAPERFYEHGADMLVAPDETVKPSMDIFSVGCVIAELFLEGQPLFELSQLLAYRRGQYDPCQHLEKIPDLGLRKMILHMIQLDPESRWSAEGYLHSYAGSVFPDYFSPFLHNFYSWLNPLDSDTKVAVCQGAFPDILKHMTGSSLDEEICKNLGSSQSSQTKTLQFMDSEEHNGRAKSSLNKDALSRVLAEDQFELLGDISTLLRDVNHSNHFSSDKMLQRNTTMESEYLQTLQHEAMQSPSQLLQAFSNVFKKREQAYMKRITLNDLKKLISEYDSESDSYSMPILQLPPDGMNCGGMILITSLLCSCIRNVKFPHLRRICILLLKSSSLYIDDGDRLQRVLPYVIAMLSDPAAIVRCAALETLCDILPLVRDFPPRDAKIFSEYILPMLSTIPDDPEESLRICYASNLSKLALTAYGFLKHSIRLTETGVLDKMSLQDNSTSVSTDALGQVPNLNGSEELLKLRRSIADIVQELVMGPRQTPNIRRALLQDIGSLCFFFGQKLSNDFLLPILPAFLNDRDEQLRTLFYEKIVQVCFFVGERSVEEYLLPYIKQALSDSTEGVLVNVLDCLTVLCKDSFLRKRMLIEMIGHAFPLLCCPSQWVRRSAVSFIVASSERLGAVDSYVYLSPFISPFVRRQPATLTSEKALFSCLKPPVSRQIFNQILESAKSSDMLERQRMIWYNPYALPKQLDNTEFLKRGVEELLSLKNWPDMQQENRNETSVVQTEHHLEKTERNDADAKLRAIGGYLSNGNSMLDSRDHLSSEKLQFSGLISPQISGMSGFFRNRSSENIPLYSFCMEQQAMQNAQAASESPLQPNALTTGSSLSPWIDLANKSSGMASSVPAPKLVSGSFSITSGSKLFHRVVHEPDGRESDQVSSLTSRFQDVGVSTSLNGSSTSSGQGSSSSDTTRSPSLSVTSSLPDSGWRPRGVLVAHLQEHRSAVNDIAVSADHSFFVSASDDSTVKVWDSRKLERDISFRSRLTYPLEGRALCAAMLRTSAQVAVGSCDGKIHTFSIDYISRGLGSVVEKYSGITDVKKREVGEGAIITIVNYYGDGFPSQTLMFSTQNCGIHLWDTRSNSSSWKLKATPGEGYVSTLVTDPCGNWFVSGSSRGVLTLWDLRFLIPVNSWEYPRPCPIEKMCLFVPPQHSPFSSMARPLVYVAAGCSEVSLWNAENGSCHQVFRVLSNNSDAELPDSPWALARPANKGNLKPDPRRNINPKYRVDELNEPPPRISGIRSLLPLPGGDLLTGGTDLKIRRWDHSRPERSYRICGPTMKAIGNDELYDIRSVYGVQVVQETRRRPLTTKLTTKTVLASAATDPGGCHRDSVVSLASVKLNQRFLISSSRDGAIKVWK
ncbi:hypothetical protein V2J09_010733 [Rumex salicifolius]